VIEFVVFRLRAVYLLGRGGCCIWLRAVSLFGRGGLWLYSLGGFVRLREEFGTPIVDWEILHGGVGGDVELGARTSKHILVFAFDPISLNSTLFTFVQASSIHIIIYTCLCFEHCFILPCIYFYCNSSILAWLNCVHCIAISLIAWLDCVCTLLGLLVCVCLICTHPTRASHSTSTHFKGNQEELVQSLARGIRLHLLYCIKFVQHLH